jgi:hypothetical protein
MWYDNIVLCPMFGLLDVFALYAYVGAHSVHRFDTRYAYCAPCASPRHWLPVLARTHVLVVPCLLCLSIHLLIPSLRCPATTASCCDAVSSPHMSSKLRAIAASKSSSSASECSLAGLVYLGAAARPPTILAMGTSESESCAGGSAACIARRCPSLDPGRVLRCAVATALDALASAGMDCPLALPLARRLPVV